MFRVHYTDQSFPCHLREQANYVPLCCLSISLHLAAPLWLTIYYNLNMTWMQLTGEGVIKDHPFIMDLVLDPQPEGVRFIKPDHSVDQDFWENPIPSCNYPENSSDP